MRTLEQLRRMWEWFVLRFVRILDKATILRGSAVIAGCANVCEKKQPDQSETPLSEQAKSILRLFDVWLVSQNELFGGYFFA